MKFLVFPRVQHYFHNPFRQFPVPGYERNVRDSVWVPPKGAGKGWRTNIGARWCCGLGDERALLCLLSHSNQPSLSIFLSLSLSPYLSTSASIDPPPATAELPPPRKASALGAYTSVDSGFSLRPPTSKKKGVDRRRAGRSDASSFRARGVGGIRRKNNLTRIKIIK